MIYDCFTYNGEEDILNIRFGVLRNHVDFFVICESEQTFSGKPKPIYYKEVNPKVIHIIAPNIETDNAFERAAHQKDYIRTYLQTALMDDDDIVYFGDVDEIWKPQEIKDDKVYNLQQLNYCYYLNYRSSEQWVGTIVGKWKTIKSNTLNHWRATHTNELPNGGWHFTNQGGAEQIRKKLESYDHQENNTLENKVLVEDRMKDGEDYVGRGVDWQGKEFNFWVDEVDLPKYLLDNKQTWIKLFR